MTPRGEVIASLNGDLHELRKTRILTDYRPGLEHLDTQVRVASRHGYAKPDKRQQRIREPIQPPEIA